MTVVIGKDVELKNAVVCEDVREEVSRKHTIVGTYSGSIHPTEFPAVLRLAAYLELWIATAGKHDLEIKVSYANKQLALAKSDLDMPAAGSAVLILPAATLTAKEQGDFVVALSRGNDEWHEVVRKRIELPPGSVAVAPAS